MELQHNNRRLFLTVGAFSAGVAVAIGAFGAHAFKETLHLHNTDAVFLTASKYHFYHAFALLLIGVLPNELQNSRSKIVGWLFIIGQFIFSGSLYVLALLNIKWLGAITPIGGAFLIAGWCFLVCNFWLHNQSKTPRA